MDDVEISESEDLELPSGDGHIPPHICSLEVPEHWIPDETWFCCEKSAVNALNAYQRANHCCLGFTRTVKPNPDRGVKGRLNIACIHGLKHYREKAHGKPKERGRQRVNFVGCNMRININQQKTGRWLLRGFKPDHLNDAGLPAHLTGLEVYNASRKAKAQVDKEALEMLKEYRAVNAPKNAMANRLSEKLGVSYTRQDVANRINNKLSKLMSDESDHLNVNTFLDEIIEGGGEVFAKYHKDSNKCRVLIVMTKYQKVDLNLSRPKVFVNDTTFGTNHENFKVTAFMIYS